LIHKKKKKDGTVLTKEFRRDQSCQSISLQDAFGIKDLGILKLSHAFGVKSNIV
jgi:hypothetical protein